MLERNKKGVESPKAPTHLHLCIDQYSFFSSGGIS